MTAQEMIELARLLLIYAQFVEPLHEEQDKQVRLAIDVLLDAQRLLRTNLDKIDVSDLPF